MMQYRYVQKKTSTLLKTLIFLFFTITATAGGIRGTVKTDKGERMPYASVFVKEINKGSLANEDGFYELNLPNGRHEVVFQFIGYQALLRQVEVTEGFLELDVVMKEVAIQLDEIKIKSGGEDPALTIMRKTISMSPFHHKEVDRYSLRSYLRGTFRLDDIPAILEKQMKKEFIEVGKTYVLESVNEIQFKQPNSITEKVISTRSNFPPTMKNQSGISYGKIDFYNPSNKTSPITVKGAANYRYSYLGFFEDKGLIVNKIRVTPKVKAPGYFSGIMNIVDNTWYVHSVDFEFEEDGLDSKLKIIFAPIQGAWMPLQLDLSSDLGMLGIDVMFRFVASFKNYQITLNPKYANVKPQVIDDKVFKTEANELNAQKIDKNAIAAQKKLSIKQLQRAMKELDKEEKQEKIAKKEDFVEEERNRTVDSLASKQDEKFWEAERQIPLTAIEVKGYQQADSLYKAKAKEISVKIKKDSIKYEAHTSKFKIGHLIAGHSYNFKPIDQKDKYKGYNYSFTIGKWTEHLRYNAVEGINFSIPSLRFGARIDSSRGFYVALEPQYSIQRNRLNGEFTLNYGHKGNFWRLVAGRQVHQVNQTTPIPMLFNAGFAFFNGQHFAKFFEQSYVALNFNPKIENKKFTLSSNFQVAERYSLSNVLSRGLQKDKLYEANELRQAEKAYPFETHLQPRLSALLTYRLFSKTVIYNSQKMTIQYGPLFRANVTSAFGKASFNQVEASVTHDFKWGLREVYLKAQTGTFLGKKPAYFLDYKHFNGNLFFIQPHNEFRELPYYEFSSSGAYAQLFGKISLKRLFITQVPYFQRKSWSENLFANVLVNNQINHIELGYGLKAFKGSVQGDIYSIFHNGNYSHTGFRIYLPFEKMKF